MTDPELFEETTEDIAELLKEFGGGVDLFEFDADTPAEDSESERGRLVKVDEPVGPDYAVLAKEGQRFFTLQSQYQLWRDVAEELTTDDVEQFAPDSIEDTHPVREVVPGFDELDEPDQRRCAATVNLLDSLPAAKRRNLILQLTAVFTRAGLKHSVGAVKAGSGVTGFTVFHRIFPYESDFSISRLNETVERVRMAAHMGELLLKYTFNLPVDLTGSWSGDVTDPGELPTRATRTVDHELDTESFSENDPE